MVCGGVRCEDFTDSKERGSERDGWAHCGLLIRGWEWVQHLLAVYIGSSAMGKGKKKKNRKKKGGDFLTNNPITPNNWEASRRHVQQISKNMPQSLFWLLYGKNNAICEAVFLIFSVWRVLVRLIERLGNNGLCWTNFVGVRCVILAVNA